MSIEQTILLSAKADVLSEHQASEFRSRNSLTFLLLSFFFSPSAFMTNSTRPHLTLSSFIDYVAHTRGKNSKKKTLINFLIQRVAR